MIILPPFSPSRCYARACDKWINANDVRAVPLTLLSYTAYTTSSDVANKMNTLSMKTYRNLFLLSSRVSDDACPSLRNLPSPHHHIPQFHHNGTIKLSKVTIEKRKSEQYFKDASSPLSTQPPNATQKGEIIGRPGAENAERSLET